MFVADCRTDGTSESGPKACAKCGLAFKTNGILDLHWQKIHEVSML